MRKYKPVLPGLTLACAAAAAPAGVIDIAWDADGRFKQQAEIPAGKFVEVCGKLGARVSVEWSFEATGATDFNIHYHVGKDVVFPTRLSQVARGQATLLTTVEQDYCWMWVNKSAAALMLNLSLRDASALDRRQGRDAVPPLSSRP